MGLESLRKQKKLNQTYVANVLNIKQATYSQYESGKRQPSIKSLKTLKELFSCTYEELINSILKIND